MDNVFLIHYYIQLFSRFWLRTVAKVQYCVYMALVLIVSLNQSSDTI